MRSALRFPVRGGGASIRTVFDAGTQDASMSSEPQPAVSGPVEPPAPKNAGRLSAHIGASGGAFSEHTERAVRADLALFRAWCAERGLSAVPALAGTVAAFIDAMAAVRAPATVRRYVFSIGLAQRAAGRPDTVSDPAVRLALKRMERQHERPQEQALGLVLELRQRLIEASAERLIDARNCALLAVAYDGMLRRSELCEARLDELAPDRHGGATLRLRRSKTDNGARCDTVYLAHDTTVLVTEWLRRGGIADGRLFRSVSQNGRVGRSLDPSQVPRIYKAMARTAGLAEDAVRAISGHSPRVGATQDMIAAGVELPAIMNAGRWKTPAMVSRYGERLLPGRSGAAQLARLQRRR